MHKPDWLAALFPWPQHSVVVNGRAMAYIDEGDRAGRPAAAPLRQSHLGLPLSRLCSSPSPPPAIAPSRPIGSRQVTPTTPASTARSRSRITSPTWCPLSTSSTSAASSSPARIGAGRKAWAPLSSASKSSPALVLMNTWLFTGLISKFHASPKPWTTWHAPLIGQFFMKRQKVLSQHGPPTATTPPRGMTPDEGRAYHHVFDEPDSDHVVLTWPRTIPLREGDRGWADMQTIERRLPRARARAHAAAL